MWFICSTIVWNNIEPYKVHLVSSLFIVHFLFVIYLCWCIVSNICMMMHPGDDMLNDTMNEGDWDVIARGGVTGDGGDG